MEPQDYYQTLGVDANADGQTVKEAYRKLALKYHPDRNADSPDAADRMKSVNEAYAVLSDPEKRQRYDLLRQQYGSSAYGQFRQSYTEQDIFNGSDIHQIFEEMARSFGLRGFDAIFKEFYGSGGQAFDFNQNGLHGRGVFFSGRSPRDPKGRANSGLGARIFGRVSRNLLEKVTGMKLPRDGTDLQDAIRLRREFATAGGPYPYLHRKSGKKLVVKIPPGVKNGQKIRLSGQGQPGQSGGRPGDLYLTVKVTSGWFDKLLSLATGR